MNIYFHSFGCKVNQSEEDYLIAESLKAGFTYTPNIEEAHYIVVNTCSVTNQAAQKCLRFIKSTANKYPQTKIVATGCAVERDAQAIKNAGAFITVNNRDKPQLLEHIQTGESTTHQPQTEQVQWENLLEFAKTKRSRAFVKIQDGCDLRCTYCIINKLRGRSRSKPVQSIIEEVQTLVSLNVREIVVVGIHIGLYGHDIDASTTLNTLIESIVAIEGDFRIRLTSLDPHEIDANTINLLANNPDRICTNMHIPLQSGSNKILKRMGRKYSAETFVNICTTLKQRIPNITIGTDVIVGFPGETSEEFQQTIDTLVQSKIDFVHHFPYSEHQEAVSAKLSGKNSAETIAKRSKQMKAEMDKLTNKQMAKLTNTTQRALSLNTNNLLGDNYCQIHIDNTITLKKNTFYNVRLTQHKHGRNFAGTIVSPEIPPD